MRIGSHVALALVVFVVAAAVDTIPDPPAVTPHTVDVNASCLRDFVGGFREEPLTCGLACTSPHAPMHRVSLADAAEPKRSSDWIKLAGYATDPSPPIL